MNQHTIPHPDICPACGSAEVVIDDADTGSGITEIVFVCLDCDTCWPLTCTTEQAATEGSGC
jgi:hypothetical protein